MKDTISRTRAVEYLDGIATDMAPKMPKGEYPEGYLHGYRAAIRALGAMPSDHDAALIADLNAEATQ